MNIELKGVPNLQFGESYRSRKHLKTRSAKLAVWRVISLPETPENKECKTCSLASHIASGNTRKQGVPNLQFGNACLCRRQRILPNCKFGTPDVRLFISGFRH
ncbi:Uncharacterized protein dnm_084150 [Desulfonema magnum]|uniref:Uncharacterized protein n=1 Tax=Desulfonema magnum TaxID=45655 RepID=A0A975GSV6_9BACT|nr:Uncharacterized protein dnm_084150 [Desulfonema magnum]